MRKIGDLAEPAADEERTAVGRKGVGVIVRIRNPARRRASGAVQGRRSPSGLSVDRGETPAGVHHSGAQRKEIGAPIGIGVPSVELAEAVYRRQTIARRAV